jgi:hypothetical protein
MPTPTLKQSIQLGIREMLKKYTDCQANNILCGYNNNVELPHDNNYIIFTIMNPERLGTPIVKFDPTEFKNSSFQDFRIDVQIDFYGQFAFDRANDIINISRTPFLCEFLKQYNIQPIECEEARNLTGVSGEREYVERWMVNLSIDYRDAVSDNQDGFNTATLNKIYTEL